MKSYTVEGLKYLLEKTDLKLEKDAIELFLNWIRESEINGKVDEILENEE